MENKKQTEDIPVREFQIRVVTEAYHDEKITTGYIEEAIKEAKKNALEKYKGRVKYIEAEEID